MRRQPIRGELPQLFRFLGRESLQCSQQIVHAGVEEVWICLAKADEALPIQDKKRAGAHALIISVDAVVLSDTATRLEIRQQREVELRLARERRVAVDAINGDTQQLRAEMRDLNRKFLIKDELVARERLPVHRIKHENNWLAKQAAQGNAAGRSLRQREVWSQRPNGQRRDRPTLLCVLMRVHRSAVPFTCGPQAAPVQISFPRLMLQRGALLAVQR